MQLRNYQIDAVDRLKRESIHLLNSDENEVLVLQAPTGSGKTIIIAEYIRQIAIDTDLITNSLSSGYQFGDYMTRAKIN